MKRRLSYEGGWYDPETEGFSIIKWLRYSIYAEIAYVILMIVYNTVLKPYALQKVSAEHGDFASWYQTWLKSYEQQLIYLSPLGGINRISFALRDWVYSWFSGKSAEQQKAEYEKTLWNAGIPPFVDYIFNDWAMYMIVLIPFIVLLLLWKPKPVRKLFGMKNRKGEEVA